MATWSLCERIFIGRDGSTENRAERKKYIRNIDIKECSPRLFCVIPVVLSFFFTISSFLKSILFLLPRYSHLPSSYLNPFPHSLIPLHSVSLDYSNLSLPLEVLQSPYTDSFAKLFLHSFQSVSFHLLLFVPWSSAVCFEIIDGLSYGNNFKLVCWKD